MTKESKLDIRKIFSSISKKPTRHYFEINREERNYAAILYAALCKRGNAEVFLKKCSCEREIEDDFAIYFEYAYLRDLWKEIGDGQTANKYKKDIIRRTLDIKGVDEILELETVAINKTFGIVGQPSKTHI